MTQKEIMEAKKKAKECLELFNIKVPMTKMKILFFYIDTDFFLITFCDVRTNDIIQCHFMNNRYEVCKHVKNTGKTLVFFKKGETND